jgi:diguanylate cyclase (GGDEF)-like protein/PAS domain S-box-containing protein
VATPLRTVILERSPETAEVLVRQLRQAGYAVQWQHADSKDRFLAALDAALDVILADYRLPGLTALEALDLLQARDLDGPLIIVSDSIGEARAVEVMKHGAADYVRRDHLARLGPAVAHAIERRWTRRAKAQADALIHFQAQLLNAVGQAVVATTVDGTIVYWNRAAEQLYGWSAEQALGRPVAEIIPDGAGAMPPLRLERLRAAGTWSGELQVRRRDGSTLSVLVTDALVRDADGGVLGIVSVATDISERRRAEEVLQASERRLRALLQHSSDMIAVLDARGIVRYISPSVEAITGYPVDEVLGRSGLRALREEDAARLQALIAELGDKPRSSRTIAVQQRHRDGSWRHLEAVVTNLLDEPGVRGIVVNARDVTERVRYEQQLAHRAFSDELTGLPNRALFMDRLSQALSQAESDAGAAALGVFCVDLDGFKLVNNSLGHGAGDMLLAAVARRLARCVRPGDTLARLSGDEFAVLAKGVVREPDAYLLAQQVVEALRQPFDLNGQEVFVTASVGFTLTAGRSGTARPEDLLREADLALHHAKRQGKASAVAFRPSMGAWASARLRLEADLRRAIERGQLRVYYQPEVELRTRRVVGVEALVRWQHPERGLISPAEFVSLAEDTGLIIPIGRWVLEEACQQGRRWLAHRRQGEPPLLISVNLSARQFAQPDLVDQVRQALQTTGLPAAHLRLEITESAVMADAEPAVRTLQALKELGVGLAIDDFGTGYSSLSYLRRFPVDTLKIDRSFVYALGKDKHATVIVSAVVVLAHTLGLAVTAEGVETAEQLARLCAVGCDRAQGFYFSPPVPASAVEEVLGDCPAA